MSQAIRFLQNCLYFGRYLQGVRSGKQRTKHIRKQNKRPTIQTWCSANNRRSNGNGINENRKKNLKRQISTNRTKTKIIKLRSRNNNLLCTITREIIEVELFVYLERNKIDKEMQTADLKEKSAAH